VARGLSRLPPRWLTIFFCPLTMISVASLSLQRRFAAIPWRLSEEQQRCSSIKE
jgi:hypothetical protein